VVFLCPVVWDHETPKNLRLSFAISVLLVEAKAAEHPRWNVPRSPSAPRRDMRGKGWRNGASP